MKVRITKESGSEKKDMLAVFVTGTVITIIVSLLLAGAFASVRILLKTIGVL